MVNDERMEKVLSWTVGHIISEEVSQQLPHMVFQLRLPAGGYYNLTQISDEPMLTDAAKSRQQTG